MMVGAISALQVCMAVAGAALQPASSAALQPWAWSVGDAPPHTGAWKTTPEPWIKVQGDRPVVLWLKTELPEPRTGELGLLIGFQMNPFVVMVGDEAIYRSPGAVGHAPWHMVIVPPAAHGRDLLIRLEAEPNRYGYVGFQFGIRVGPPSEHYLRLLREEWTSAALAVVFLTIAVVALGAQVLARARGESRPFAPLAALCAAYGGWLLNEGAGHVAAFIYPRQDVLEIASYVMGALIPAAEVWYIRRAYDRRIRFGLTAVVSALALYGVATGFGRLTGMFTLRYGLTIFNCLSIPANVLILANVVAAWPSCSKAMRVVSLGLVINELCSFADSVVVMGGLSGRIPSPASVGFAAFLLFLLASLLIVSSERRVEENRERMRAAGTRAIAQAATALAHDVRKPFALMRITLDRVEEASTLEQARAALRLGRREIRDTTRSVEDMIAEILEVGSESRLELKPEEIDDVLSAVLSTLRRAGDARDVAFVYELNHRRQVLIHRFKVERALMNIICNGLQAMCGQGSMWFRTRDVARLAGDFVELTIGNSGPCIPEERIAKIFEPFFTAEKPEGTGLGLTIAKNVVEAHGGTIGCRSAREFGVEFTLSWPAGEVSPGTGLVLPGRLGTLDEPRPRPAASEGHVLLVEDSSVIRAAWREHLPEGVLREYASPTDCLRAVDDEVSIASGARWIVLDNRFAPDEIDGLELGRRLRERTSSPILLCSGVALEALPPWFDGQLSKDAHDVASLEHAVSGAEGHGGTRE